MVIAEIQTFGACIEVVLRGQGYDVTIVESYGKFSDALQNLTSKKFDLVIATNTCLTPARIQNIIPDIKARYPHARIIVLSGYSPDDFVADLKQKGIDVFHPLPFGETALLKEVAGLMSEPPPDPGEVSILKK